MINLLLVGFPAFNPLSISIPHLVLYYSPLLHISDFPSLQICEDGIANNDIPSNLIHLTKELPFIIKNSIAPSTFNKYHSSWKKWVNWANHNNISPIVPAKAIHVALYLTHLKKARGTRGAIDDAIQGIRWGHDFNGFPTPTNNKFVARVAEGCKRLCTPVKKQRDFLTQEDILELTNSVDRDDIAQLRFIVIILLGFAGFLRISDILNLKVRNLEFDEQKLKIHIERSKNDQLSIGNDIYINRSGNQSCPVSFIRDYLLKGFVDLKDKNIFLIGKLKK